MKTDERRSGTVARLYPIEGKMFIFSILGVFRATTWAPEDLLKKTKFLVNVSMISNDYDMRIK